jgi:hypothetical protein
MKQLLADIRYALRQLRRAPSFALTAVFTLAVGIGATTAIFSMVEGVLLRPLPFHDPGRLVAVGDAIEGLDPSGNLLMTTSPGVRLYERDTHSFTGLGGYHDAGYELSGMGEPASIFPTLGVSPLMGRTFTEQGIYSVIAFSAAMRSHELAIRLALGAQPSGVLRLVLASGAKLGLAGCTIGAIGAVLATRLLRSLLFNVNLLDPLVLAFAARVLFALAASVLPAWRAASIQPMQALRTE